MAEDTMLEEGKKPKKAARPTPKYDEDINVQARKRASKRSSNRNLGKPEEEGVNEAPVAEAPPENDGGIVAEAEQELEMVQGAAEEAAPGETSEMPAEETAEPEAAAEMPAEEPSAPEAAAEEAAETPAEEAAETPAMEAAEPAHQMPSAYQAPNGESHDELMNQYHEALTYGDVPLANELYKKLQEHRYAENMHRGKTEAQAEKELQEYLSIANDLAGKHPELGEDGLAANKVLALSDVYRQDGMPAAAALQKAVADLYPEMPMAAAAPEMPMPAEAAPEPMPEPIAEVAPEPMPEPEAAAPEPVVPDMTERKLQKRNIPAMPSAAARNEPPPPKKEPTRSDAIQEMKRARGQI